MKVRSLVGLILVHESLHAGNGAGQQTGWTGLVAKLLHRSRE